MKKEENNEDYGLTKKDIFAGFIISLWALAVISAIGYLIYKIIRMWIL